MIEINKLIREFSQADMQAYLNANPTSDLQFKKFFPLKYTTDLTFEALSADFGAKVAADVVSFDARAPRKGRPDISKIINNIPKVEIARVKNETKINTYYRLLDKVSRSSNPAIAKQLVDYIYEDTRFVDDGVNAREEWMSKQIASTGKGVLSMVNNEAGVATVVPIDFGIPSANFVNAGIDYTTGTTHDPIADIKALQTAAKAKGFNLMYATLDQSTFDLVAKSASLQKEAAGYFGAALNMLTTPTLDTVNQVMRAKGLPQFRVWESYVTIESKAGALTVDSGWQYGNISFTVSPTFGDTQWTDTAESYIDFDASVKAQRDFVLVKAFANQDPIEVVTKGVAYATPVLQGANGIYILKTKLS